MRILRRSSPALALALPAALLLAGCGLFSTRAPDRPPSGPGILTNFTSPDSAMATIQRAVHAKSTDVYIVCLADTAGEQRDFHATFDPADETAFEQTGGIVPPDWTRAQEQSFFPQFAAYLPNAPYDLYLWLDTDRGGIIDEGGPTQKKIYNEHYRVWAGASPVCAGSAALTFERVGGSGQYKLTFWADRRDTVNVRTWGMARLNGR